MYLKPHVEARHSCGLSISDFSEELVFLPMILNAVYRRLHLINIWVPLFSESGTNVCSLCSFRGRAGQEVGS